MQIHPNMLNAIANLTVAALFGTTPRVLQNSVAAALVALPVVDLADFAPAAPGALLATLRRSPLATDVALRAVARGASLAGRRDPARKAYTDAVQAAAHAILRAEFCV